jgi:hypothetical protein
MCLFRFVVSNLGSFPPFILTVFTMTMKLGHTRNGLHTPCAIWSYGSDSLTCDLLKDILDTSRLLSQLGKSYDWVGGGGKMFCALWFVFDIQILFV